METTVLAEIRRLQQLSVAELQQEWPRLYNGEPCRSRNRAYLVRRLCWRVQELRLGGLGERARGRLEELGSTEFTRARTPAGSLSDSERSVDVPAGTGLRRDPRLPVPGTVITRNYRCRELRLLVLDDGFELDGVRYGSLSEAARAITGSRWNGRLFWGLTTRKRKS